MSLSPGWRLGESFDSNVYPDIHANRNDEVELFLEKYVLPLQDSSSEYDSGGGKVLSFSSNLKLFF